MKSWLIISSSVLTLVFLLGVADGDSFDWNLNPTVSTPLDTGITLVSGDVVSIFASESTIQLNYNTDRHYWTDGWSWGAEGQPPEPAPENWMLPGAPVGSLLARIDEGEWFFTGADHTTGIPFIFTSGENGTLYLTLNEVAGGDYTDNTGMWSGSIEVIPEPATLLLLTLGGLFLRRK